MESIAWNWFPMQSVLKWNFRSPPHAHFAATGVSKIFVRIRTIQLLWILSVHEFVQYFLNTIMKSWTLQEFIEKFEAKTPEFFCVPKSLIHDWNILPHARHMFFHGKAVEEETKYFFEHRTKGYMCLSKDFNAEIYLLSLIFHKIRPWLQFSPVLL